jgi:hypothetical protein
MPSKTSWWNCKEEEGSCYIREEKAKEYINRQGQFLKGLLLSVA